MYDEANPDSKAETNVSISVTRNANRPRFEPYDYRRTVLEIVPIGTSITQVIATDKDKVRIYIELRYQIANEKRN